ncbi:MAG: signal peptidase II [Bdellovibrio sp.]|nr:signal peptidase II [Bdellovibrio sp.]
MKPMTLKYKLSVVITLLVLILTFDQATKKWAVQTLMGQSPHYFLNGLFQFVYAENPGAFLGIGGGLSREVRFVVFALIVFFGLGGMLWYLFKGEKSRLNLFAYSFILSGGFGNLWDRVIHESGHVIDFMLIDIWGPIRTGVFNVADMAIVAGVLLAIYGEIRYKKSKAEFESVK